MSISSKGVIKQSALMQSASEDTEMRARCSSQITLATPVTKKMESDLRTMSSLKYGTKARELFLEQLGLAPKYTFLQELETLDDGGLRITIVYVDNHSLQHSLVAPHSPLATELLDHTFQCDCGDSKSLGVPCRHIICFLQHQTTKFACYQKYFHKRWELNGTLPIKLRDIANSQAIQLLGPALQSDGQEYDFERGPSPNMEHADDADDVDDEDHRASSPQPDVAVQMDTDEYETGLRKMTPQQRHNHLKALCTPLMDR